jgi:hypothetical protein
MRPSSIYVGRKSPGGNPNPNHEEWVWKRRALPAAC